MKFYDRTGKKHKTFVGAITASVMTKVDETLTKKARGYREAGEDRYDETPGAYTHGEENEPIVVPYDDSDEWEGSKYTLFTRDASRNVEAFPVEHEVEAPAQKISIDYAHHRIILEDADGNIIATSPIDEKLVRGTIDETLLDVLYPDGNVPETVKMNVQSMPVTTKPLILDTDGNPIPSTNDTPSSDGPCG